MNKKLFALLASTAVIASSPIYSGGFALIEQSVSAMGTAYAGTAALGEDASTIWFNPAGLMRLCGCQTVDGAHLVIPTANYDDEGSIALTGLQNPPIQPLTGNNGHNAGENAGVAHSYFSKRINYNWAVGLGINSPFGLVTDYDHGWVGRYYALRSSLLTININPTIAYRFNSCWSIGAGFNAMYLHAKLSNKVDFGLIGVSALGPELAGQLGLAAQQNDGYVKLRGNSWAFGGNIGILWEPSCHTRVGLSFRSEMKHGVKGTEKFDDIPQGILLTPLANVFENTRTKADVTLPSSIYLSGYHQFNSCWAVVGDVQWTKWDVLQRLRFRFNNELQPDGITTFKWENTWRGAIGAIYTPNACWKLRGGLAYDQDPTPNKELRSPRLPGNDRIWLAFGAGYDLSCNLHIDVGYAHLFFKTPKIDKRDFEYEEDLTRGGLYGKYDAYGDIVSAQIVYNF